MYQTTATKTIHRALKFRAFPSPNLIPKLEAHFLATEEIFNYLLDLNTKYHEEHGQDIDSRTMASLAARQGKNYPITNRQAAYYVAPRLTYGLMRSKKEGEGGLKKKEVGGIKASFTINCSSPVFKILRGGAKKRASFYIPLIGEIVVANHRELPLDAKFKLCTVSRNPSGEYYVSLDYEAPISDNPGPGKIKRPIGLDFSVPKLYVASDRTLSPEADMLTVRKRYAKKISMLHKKLSHSKVGGKNYGKIRKRLAKVYQRIDNIRNDYIQKETRKIVDNYDFVGVETLSLTEMCERYKFYNAIHDDSWFRFLTTLRYKMQDARKTLRYVSRFYPSSKTCHRCGYIKHDLQLSDREYVCPICHNHDDRDYNAAKNIRDQALRDAGYRINYIYPANSQGAKQASGNQTAPTPAMANNNANRPAPPQKTLTQAVQNTPKAIGQDSNKLKDHKPNTVNANQEPPPKQPPIKRNNVL
ncbi:MAG: transposase [Bacilli bacterium]|nr:transposase [Bacilli bacterium]